MPNIRISGIFRAAHIKYIFPYFIKTTAAAFQIDCLLSGCRCRYFVAVAVAIAISISITGESGAWRHTDCHGYCKRDGYGFFTKFHLNLPVNFFDRTLITVVYCKRPRIAVNDSRKHCERTSV